MLQSALRCAGFDVALARDDTVPYTPRSTVPYYKTFDNRSTFQWRHPNISRSLSTAEDDQFARDEPASVCLLDAWFGRVQTRTATTLCRFHPASPRIAPESIIVTEFTGFSLTRGKDQADASVCNQSPPRGIKSSLAGDANNNKQCHTQQLQKNRIPPWRSEFPALAVQTVLTCAERPSTRERALCKCVRPELSS